MARSKGSSVQAVADTDTHASRSAGENLAVASSVEMIGTACLLPMTKRCGGQRRRIKRAGREKLQYPRYSDTQIYKVGENIRIRPVILSTSL